jgi:hypothetical protein
LSHTSCALNTRKPLCIPTGCCLSHVLFYELMCILFLQSSWRNHSRVLQLWLPQRIPSRFHSRKKRQRRCAALPRALPVRNPDTSYVHFNVTECVSATRRI